MALLYNQAWNIKNYRYVGDLSVTGIHNAVVPVRPQCTCACVPEAQRRSEFPIVEDQAVDAHHHVRSKQTGHAEHEVNKKTMISVVWMSKRSNADLRQSLPPSWRFMVGGAEASTTRRFMPRALSRASPRIIGSASRALSPAPPWARGASVVGIYAGRFSWSVVDSITLPCSKRDHADFCHLLLVLAEWSPHLRTMFLLAAMAASLAFSAATPEEEDGV